MAITAWLLCGNASLLCMTRIPLRFTQHGGGMCASMLRTIELADLLQHTETAQLTARPQHENSLCVVSHAHVSLCGQWSSETKNVEAEPMTNTTDHWQQASLTPQRQ